MAITMPLSVMAFCVLAKTSASLECDSYQSCMDADVVSLLQRDTVLQDESTHAKLKPEITTNEELLQEIKAMRESQHRHDQELKGLKQQLSSLLEKPEHADTDMAPALFHKNGTDADTHLGLIADSADDEEMEGCCEGQCAFCYSCGGDFPKVGGKLVIDAAITYGLGKECAQPKDPHWKGTITMESYILYDLNQKEVGYKNNGKYGVRLCCKA